MKKNIIANRGEIAIRVMKTAQKMGIKRSQCTPVDRNAPHVKFADEVVWKGITFKPVLFIGDKIIEVAKSLGGCYSSWYGILSENADLPRKQNKTTSHLFNKSHTHNGSVTKEAVKAYNIPWVPA
jgi:propionyl-CoA carboxylase alpha chain